MPLSVLFWNARGLDPQKADWLRQNDKGWHYNNLDVVIIAEAKSTPQLAGITVQESNRVTPLNFDDGDVDLAAAALMDRDSIVNTGSHSSINRYYEYVSPVGLSLGYSEEVDYTANKTLMEWLKAPIRKFIDGKKLKVYLEAKRVKKPVLNKRDLRKDINSARFNPLGGFGVEWIVGLTRSNREAKVEDAVELMKHRLFVFSQRLPRRLLVNGVEVYFWHAPQAGGRSPDSIGLRPVACDGRCGPIANSANQLLAAFLGVQSQRGDVWQTRGLGSTTVIAGDLNITNLTAQGVWTNSNIASSGDDLCHIIYPVGWTRSISAPTDKGGSDHAPVCIS